MDKTLPAIGFIGCGALSTALITGFCERAADTPYPIIVSNRTPKAAEALAERFPDRVTAAASFQECVDKSDWVVIAVLPEAGESVVRSLTFRPEHKIVNVMFDKTAATVASWMNVPPAKIVYLLPGTFNAFCHGPMILCPPDGEAAEIFGQIGEITPLRDPSETAVYAAVTACFAPLFAVMDEIISWMVGEQGAAPEQAVQYVTGVFTAIAAESMRKDRNGIHTMATVSTPGGINMQALAHLRETGAFSEWRSMLTEILVRTSEDVK